MRHTVKPHRLPRSVKHGDYKDSQKWSTGVHLADPAFGKALYKALRDDRSHHDGWRYMHGDGERALWRFWLALPLDGSDSLGLLAAAPHPPPPIFGPLVAGCGAPQGAHTTADIDLQPSRSQWCRQDFVRFHRWLLRHGAAFLSMPMDIA